MNFALLVIVLLPFAIFGWYKILQVLKQQMNVKKGKYKIKRIMSNGRLATNWCKPENGIFDVNKDTKLQFLDEPKGIFYEGKTPVVWYIGDTQVFKEKGNEKQDPKLLSSMFFRIYNLGKSQAEQNEKYVLYVGLGCLVVSVLTLLLVFSFMKQYDQSMSALTGLVNSIKITTTQVV